MNNELIYLKNNLNPFRLFKTKNYREWKVFPFHGIIMFEGKQGSGKTLNLTNYVHGIIEDWREVKVFSNVEINSIEHISYSNPSELITMLQNVCGAIVIIDEVNILFPSTDKPSKEFLHLVSLLRHNEILCIGTCQVFNRVSKFLREQTSYIVCCSSPFHGLSFNRVYTIDYEKMMLCEDSGNVKSALVPQSTHIYFHCEEDYKRYDTHATVEYNLMNRSENNEC